MLRDVSRIYDIEDLAAKAGVLLKGAGRKKWGVCPMPFHPHSSYTPSFSIYWRGDKQMFKCHGACGAQGDAVDFIGFMTLPGYRRFDRDLYKQAAEILTGGEYRPSLTLKPPPPEPRIAPWKWEEFLPPSENVIKYAYNRGLTDAELTHYRIGSASRLKDGEVIKEGEENLMSLPTFHHGELMGIKLRKLSGTGKYRYFSVAGGRQGLFGYDDVYLTEGPVLMVKGEIAAAVCTRFGFRACAPTGGEGALAHEIQSIQKALALAKVVMVGDNDKNPKTRADMRAAAEKRAALFGADLRFPPEEFKDIDEWLLADPEGAKKEIGRWLCQ